ncbi:MAG: hypothetical protein ABI969_02740 [bacterium]
MHSSLDGDVAVNLRLLQRRLATLLPEARAAGAESTLEIASQGYDAPRLISATVLEGTQLQAIRVAEPPTPGFRAFLDGTQRSRVAMYMGTAPLVHGNVAAVIRERRDRRMHTWHAPLAETRIYAPRAVLAPVTWNTLEMEFGEALVDTTDGQTIVASHPFALRDAAVHRVQGHREELEQRLAEEWCADEGDALFIDGGISGSEKVAISTYTIGVVKSHRTLYAEGDALATVLSLGSLQRSSVFRVTSSKRTTVASWYLRLRDATGHDPMWGLVRVEMALPVAAQMSQIGARADEVSRWILAEASPLALPDARWDKMVYGVRDCEEFLRAVQ